jgi:hypothetical protein
LGALIDAISQAFMDVVFGAKTLADLSEIVGSFLEASTEDSSAVMQSTGLAAIVDDVWANKLSDSQISQHIRACVSAHGKKLESFEFAESMVRYLTCDHLHLKFGVSITILLISVVMSGY